MLLLGDRSTMISNSASLIASLCYGRSSNRKEADQIPVCNVKGLDCLTTWKCAQVGRYIGRQVIVTYNSKYREMSVK